MKIRFIQSLELLRIYAQTRWRGLHTHRTCTGTYLHSGKQHDFMKRSWANQSSAGPIFSPPLKFRNTLQATLALTVQFPIAGPVHLMTELTHCCHINLVSQNTSISTKYNQDCDSYIVQRTYNMDLLCSNAEDNRKIVTGIFRKWGCAKASKFRGWPQVSWQCIFLAGSVKFCHQMNRT